ncbi:MAG: ATP-binding protein [Magnetococcales bacterium]|nr:ATP-binding protein [Magnetococcales bacterium]
MTITPWREIAVPHQDVLKGTFQESEFAADISQVHQGKASREYQDPVQFFSRTFITEGMALLLDSVIRRLAGQSGDPIIQLQTAFGGGKTHTMLAVYHLAQRKTPASDLHGIPPLLDKAGITDLSPARVAVIDGTNLSVSKPKIYGNTQCHTIWGALAWQLGGESSYLLVRSADESGTSPDKDTVIEMLSKAAPCVILMDELVAFYRQFQEGKMYPAGSFETNMTFIQALTEGIKSVPKAVMLASLPDSSNAGEGRGQIVLSQLESYFRRLHKIWKPVSKDEAFSIVRRRLFDHIEDHLAMENTCQAFAKFYIANKVDFPNETQESQYLERMRQAYPIHPEIFDRLYEDWSTLQGFQRTRGVLQLLAQVIHRLWKDGNSDPMIMPGALPLFDAMVRNKCLDYLPQGWDPVIDQDIDGETSKPATIENEEARFGQIHAARRVTRTIFLASAPGAAGRISKGVELERILLGVGRPDQPLGHYKDVLKRLMDRLNFLNTANERFWFGLTPNLRREMESRKQRFHDQYDVIPLLRSKMERVIGKGELFSGVHIFTPSADIPDEYGSTPRLIVLPPCGASYHKGAANTAFQAAEEILRNRGDHPRQKQNRLLFLAADYDIIARVWDQAKNYLAWNSIAVDIENEKLVLDTIQVRQAKQYKDNAERALQLFLREAYRWLINPYEIFERGKPTLKWEAVTISPTASGLVKAIEEKAVEEEWLIKDWSAIHLADILQKWYFKEEKTETSALKVWQDTCHYLYLPRLINNDVFKKAMAQGVETEDFFGYAVGKNGDHYLGFVFGRSGLTSLDEEALLIERKMAKGVQEKLRREQDGKGESGTTVSTGTGGGVIPPPIRIPHQPAKNRFYGTVTLDPIKAKIDFATIVDEVIAQFTSRVGVDITISVEIEASKKDGFDETVQRTVKENCTVLRFVSAEFEA